MMHGFRRSISVFIIGFAVIAIGQLGISSVHADEVQSQAITLSPASTDISIDPGTSIAKSIDIINSGNGAFNVNLTTDPYYVSGENYDPHFTQLPGTVDASHWVHLSLNQAPVNSLKVLTVPYTITVPAHTTPGGYYAIIFAETSADNAQSGVISHNRVGNILYITVNGPVTSGGTLTGESLPAISFASSIPIGTTISNSGGTHFITTALYTVTDSSGKKVFNADTERHILPQTMRKISVDWTPQSLFGLYTVHRSATIAGVTKTLPDGKILIVNPWALIAVTFFIGILVGIPVERARRRRHSRKK